MKANIRVGMPIEPLIMRNFHSAQCNKTARNKPVHVIAVSCPNIWKVAHGGILIGHCDILGR